MAVDVKFEIVERIVVLKDRKPAWDLELNRVSWNGNEPRYDIREWKEEHTRCGTGITLGIDELKKLVGYCEEDRIRNI